MIIIANTAFPTEHSNEMGKRFGKLPPLPAYMTQKGPYVNSEVGLGVKTVSLYEFDQSKTKEAMEFVGDRYTKFFGVPGFTYSILVWYDVIEAFKMIGLA